jgi:chemotaxis regulatin CheY-phosphate phosphatase CheZ
MTTLTSPKPPTPADPNDLRTDLTKLADEWAGWTEKHLCDDARTLLVQIRALLAAHPAPECECVESRSETCP